MTLREGNLEAPTRHPIDWQGADYHDEAQDLRRDGAGVRHLPRLPPLRQPVPVVPDPVRPGRRHRRRRGARRRQEGLRQGRRPVLPVRPLLHDQVPVRAAASVERRLPAPDAARQGDQATARARSAAARSCSPRPTCTASSPASRSSSQAVNAANRTQPVRKVLDGALDVHPDAWLPALATQALPLRAAKTKGARPRSSTASAARARSRCSRPASSTTTSPASATTCSRVLEHNAIPYEIVEKESCCGMPKLELGDLEGVARHKDAEHPGARALCARGLGDRARRSRRAR